MDSTRLVHNAYEVMAKMIEKSCAKRVTQDAEGKLDLKRLMSDLQKEVSDDKIPFLLIDLARVTRNLIALRLHHDDDECMHNDKEESITTNGIVKNTITTAKVCEQELHFSVSACPDEFVLATLEQCVHTLVFEVADVTQVRTLQSLGVDRIRTVLVTTLVSQQHIYLFPFVRAVCFRRHAPDDPVIVESSSTKECTTRGAMMNTGITGARTAVLTGDKRTTFSESHIKK